MPTRARLESALRNAHAAGDTQAARALANALKSGQYDDAQQSTSGYPQQSPQELAQQAEEIPGVPTGDAPEEGQRSGLERAGRTVRELGQKLGAPAKLAVQSARSFPESIPGQVANEAARGGVQGAVRLVDLFSTDVANNLMAAAGSDKRTMTLEELLNQTINLDQPAMEEGTAQRAANMAGQVVAPGAAGGAALRQVAKAVPRGVGPGSVSQNVVRQLGSGNAATDVAMGAASGAGASVGGDVGGPAGAMIGGMAAPMATAAAAPRAMRALAGTADDGLPPGASKRSFPETPDEAAGRAAGDATGIDLLPAQRSLDPQRLRSQRFLPELTPTAQKASAVLAKQNKQASQAVDEFVSAIAPDDSVVTGSERFRGASQRALEAAKQVRSEKASPHYQQAFQEGADVDLAPVREAMESSLADFPEAGGVARSIRKVSGLLGERPSLKQLHNAKLEIDDMLSKVMGDDSLGNTAKRELRGLKQVLVDQMEAASPAYREGRLTFEAASPPVNKLQDSIIGKIANMDDTQLKNVARRIFDPAETNQTVVKNAKRVIDDVDPDAWNRLLRSEVERRIGSLKPEVGTSFENMPSKLKNAIFGTGKQRDAILSGMTKTQRQNAELLEKALERAGLGRPGGSETAGRGEFLKEMGRGGIVRTVKNWLRSPVDEVISVGDDSLFDRRAKALADTLFDPAYAGEATKALKDPTGKSFGYLLYLASENAPKSQATEDQGQPQRSPQPAAR